MKYLKENLRTNAEQFIFYLKLLLLIFVVKSVFLQTKSQCPFLMIKSEDEAISA